MKKELGIAIISTSKFLFSVGAVLTNLKDINFKYDGFHILSCDLTEDEMKPFIETWGAKFELYSLKEFEKEFDIQNRSHAYLNGVNKLTHLIYIKYRLLKLLEFYKKILIIDADVLFTSADFSSLFKLKGIAWRASNAIKDRYGKSIFDSFPYHDIRKELSREFGTIDYTTCNAGLIYATDDIDYNKCITVGDMFLKKYYQNFWVLDEVVFPYLVHSVIGEDNLTLLNIREYNIRTFNYKDYSKFIHFFGGPKPWSSLNEQLLFPKWKEYYLEFIKHYHGCTTELYTDFSSDISEKYKEELYKQYWNNLLSMDSFVLPDCLKFNYKVGRKHNYLIFDYKKDMYFEFVTSLYTSQVYIGFWFKNTKLINGLVKTFCNQLVEKDAKLFSVKNDSKGLYIYTEKMNIELAVNRFNFFVNTILGFDSPFKRF